MATDYKRVHRLLKLITLIQSGGQWSPKRLAEACGTTERSIFRDLKALEKAGIPFKYDGKRKTYVVEGDFFLPPIQLTVEEALAIVALGENVGGLGVDGAQVPHLSGAMTAAEKVRAQLGFDVREKLGKTGPRLSIRLAAAGTSEQTESAFQTVLRAIEGRTALDVAYESVTSIGAKKPKVDNGFRLLPYELMFNQRAWYVLGYSKKHDEVRSFKLSRFVRLRETAEVFDMPAGWSLEKHLGNAWRMIKGKRRYTVELLFTPEFGETVSDTRWHKTQEVEELEDGSVRFTADVDGLDEIKWWVLGMGPGCKVVKPAELVTEVRELARRTAALYDGKTV